MKAIRLAPLAVALLAAVLSGPAAADALGDKAQAIVKANAATVVTVRVVLDVKFAGQTREQRLNARGVAVSDTGLIMAALTTIKPNVNVRGPRGRSIEFKIVPSDIKIVFEKDEKEYDAFVVVKDTKRGLVFLQVKDFKPGQRKIQWVDFARSARPNVGDQVVTVLRLSKGYDYATYFRVSRVIGRLKKPRKAHLLNRGYAVGLPVFDLDGKLLGCHALMKSSLPEHGRRRAGQPVVLSAREVHAVIKQALKKAAEGDSEGKGEAEASGK